MTSFLPWYNLVVKILLIKNANPLMDILSFSWCTCASLYNWFYLFLTKSLKGWWSTNHPLSTKRTITHYLKEYNLKRTTTYICIQIAISVPGWCDYSFTDLIPRNVWLWTRPVRFLHWHTYVKVFNDSLENGLYWCRITFFFFYYYFQKFYAILNK
jgi:hypothetical protein